MKRGTPLPRVGRRAKRELSALQVFRRAVLERDGRKCRRCGWVPDPRAGEQAMRLEVHHLLPRSRGGRHNESNGAVLCSTCHAAAHDHSIPDWSDWIRSSLRSA